MTRPSLVLNTLTPCSCYRTPSLITHSRQSQRGTNVNVHVLKRRLTSSSTDAAHHVSSSSSASSSPPPLPSIFRNPLQWYVTKLDTHPVTTKCITSGIISGSGDLLCQYLTKKSNNSNSSNTDTHTITNANDNNDGQLTLTAVNNENKKGTAVETNDDDDGYDNYDILRTIRFTILGSFLVAPTVHKWYGFLMSSIPGSSIGSIAKRLFYDQGLFAPIFTPMFISCLTVLEHVIPDGSGGTGGGGGDGDGEDSVLQQQPNNGQKSNDFNNIDLYTHLTNRLMNDVPDAIVVGWQLWIPSMAFMFACVPSKFQVLYSNGVGFVWNAYLSWKTHEGERNTGGDE